MTRLTQKIIDFIAFFDRNFNLLFCRNSCFTIELLSGDSFYYNDIINDGTKRFRCLGKNQYKQLKTK